jgi:hypothetical protein
VGRIRSWLRERRYRKWERHYLEDPWRRQVEQPLSTGSALKLAPQITTDAVRRGVASTKVVYESGRELRTGVS